MNELKTKNEGFGSKLREIINYFWAPAVLFIIGVRTVLYYVGIDVSGAPQQTVQYLGILIGVIFIVGAFIVEVLTSILREYRNRKVY
jgi:cytochrome c biogenesis protein CcdA